MKRFLIRNQWFRYFILTFLLLIIPYNFELSVTRHSNDIIMKSIFYYVNSTISPIFFLYSGSIISFINLILLIIPSTYFTYRRLSRYEGEKLEILGVITILLSMLVTYILDSTAFTSYTLEDLSPTPTPNYPFLPIFTILLLCCHVVYPLLKEHLQIRATIAFPGGAKSLSARMRKFVPRTASGWIIIILLLLPSLISVNLSAIQMKVMIMFTLFVIGFGTTLQTSSVDFNIEFLIGGTRFLELMLLSSVWILIFMLALALYLMKKIKRAHAIVVTLISIAPSLFFIIVDAINCILLLELSIIIPLPLVQIGGFILLRQTEKVRELEKQGISEDASSLHVTIPLSYVIKSMFKRRGRWKRGSDNGSKNDTNG